MRINIILLSWKDKNKEEVELDEQIENIRTRIQLQNTCANIA